MAGLQLAKSVETGFLAVVVPPPYEGYTVERDEREYARALLTPEQLERLKEDVASAGYMTVTQVRNLVDTNTSARFTSEGIYTLDADLIAQIDMRIKEAMFVLPDNSVLSREELLASYPFAEFQTTPEKIFAQQEIGVFPVRASNLDQTAKEHLARDLGSGDEFVMFEDFIGREAREDYVNRRPIERTVKTKIFLAREGWDDFMALSKHIRALRRIVVPVVGHAGLGAMLGGPAPGAPLSLESADSFATRLEKQSQAIEAREQRLREREELLASQSQKLADLIEGLGNI